MDDLPAIPARIRAHIRSNVIGYLALFVALGGTATATHLVVRASDIQDDAVRSRHVLDGQVRARDVDVGAITRAKLRDEAVNSAKVAANSLRAADLAPNSVGGSELGGGSVGSAELSAGAFVGGDIGPDGGANHGILGNAVQGFEVSPDTLSGFDIDESSLGSPLVRSIQLVASTTALDSIGSKSIIVTCPAGKRLIGGGAAVEAATAEGAPPNGPALLVNRPRLGVEENRWHALAKEVVSTSADWRLRATAICAAG